MKPNLAALSCGGTFRSLLKQYQYRRLGSVTVELLGRATCLHRREQPSSDKPACGACGS
ncbi:hypothetical protein THIX_60670 [Thiomonas sp. X19]|nr:hypothetical protein THIX_60670 [Thiomonas sp. X19]